MLQMAGFSFLYAAGFTIVDLFLTAISAYVIAKYRFPGRNLLYTIGIVVMIVPIVGSLPSAMQISKALGVYDNMLLRILLCHGCVFSGFNFLLLHGNFKEMPWDYAEAVFIDGGNHYTRVFQDVFADDFSDIDGVVRAWFLGRLERLRNLHGVVA